MAPMQTQNRQAQLLLIEDNTFDVFLTTQGLKETKHPHQLHIVEDGEQALDFLHQRGKFNNVPRPDLILLDLNLPRKDGRDVLAEVKAHPLLRSIPIIVLTTSNAEEDVMKTYNLHVNCFITKPINVVEFTGVIRSITDFWLSIAALPRTAA